MKQTVYKAERNKTLQLAEQVGCLTNRFIGHKQQYFLRRALPVTVYRGAKQNYSAAQHFLTANLYKCFEIFVVAMRYVRCRMCEDIPSMKSPRQNRRGEESCFLKATSDGLCEM